MILSLDVGSRRMGWCILDNDSSRIGYVNSGILGLDQEPDQKYNDYRLQMIDYWCQVGSQLLNNYEIDLVVNEMMPMINPERGRASASQSILAISAITAFQTICRLRDIPVKQISAITVKKRLTGDAKATKVKVRDSVYKLVPEVERLYKDVWKGNSTPWADESDSIAIGLSYLLH